MDLSSCPCYILLLSIFLQVGGSVYTLKLTWVSAFPCGAGVLWGSVPLRPRLQAAVMVALWAGSGDQLGLHARMARHKRPLHTLTWAFRQIQIPRRRFWIILECFTVGFDLKEWGIIDLGRSGDGLWELQTKHQVIGHQTSWEQVIAKHVFLVTFTLLKHIWRRLR